MNDYKQELVKTDRKYHLLKKLRAATNFVRHLQRHELKFFFRLDCHFLKCCFVCQSPLKSGSHLPKKFVLFGSMKALYRWREMLLFHRKSFFRSQFILIFVLDFWLYKTTWLEISCWFQNLWLQSLVNKQLQYKYCLISHEVKATRKWNLVN